MAEAATAADPYEKRYKDLQSTYTQTTQELADLRRRIEAGEILERDKRDAEILEWAKTKPDEAREWLGWEQPKPNGNGRSSSSPLPVDALMGDAVALGDRIFDPESEEHTQFKRQYGDEGLRQAGLRRYGKEIAEGAGISKELTEHNEILKSLRSELDQVKKVAERSNDYSVASWNQVQVLRDPTLGKIQELQQKLHKDPGYWRDIISRIEMLETPAKTETQKATPATPQAPSAEHVAAAIASAQAIPVGAGPHGGAPDSRTLDPFDRAVLEAREELTARR